MESIVTERNVDELNSPEKFIGLLKGLLSANISERNSATVLYESALHSAPESLLEALIETLLHTQDGELKILICILLRQIFANRTTFVLWSEVPLQKCDKLTQGFVIYARAETDSRIYRYLAETLIEYNNSVYFCRKTIIFEVLELAISSCETDTALPQLGFYVLSGYFVYFYDYFDKQKEKLFKIFERHLTSAATEVRIACIYAFCSLVITINLPEAMYFGQLLSKLLGALVILPSNESLFSILIDSAEAEPFYYSNKMPICLKFSNLILKSDKTPQCKYLYCHFLAEICKGHPDIPKTHIINSIEAIKSFMLTLEIALPDNIETDYLDLCGELISNIFSTHLELVPDFVANICETIYKSDLKWAALSLIQLEKLVKFSGEKSSQLAAVLISSTNDYINFLTLKCIENLWRYTVLPIFQTQAPLELAMVYLGSSCEPLRLQACKSLTCFIERSPKSTISSTSLTISDMLLNSMTPHSIKLNLTLLRSLLRRLRDSFNSYPLLPKLFPLLTSNSALESLRCIIEIHHTHSLNSHFPSITAALNLQSLPISLYSLPFWEILFKNFPSQCTPYITIVLPQLLFHILRLLQSKSEDVEPYIQSLCCILSCSGAYTASYLEVCIRIYNKLLESDEFTVLQAAVQLSSVIVKATRACNLPDSVNIVKGCWGRSWELFVANPAASIRLELLLSMKSIVSSFAISIFSDEEAQNIAKNLSSGMENCEFEVRVELFKLCTMICVKHNDCGKFVENCYREVEKGLIVASEKEKYLAVSGMCEALKAVGKNGNERVIELCTLLFRLVGEEDEKIREKAIEGIGIMAVYCSESRYGKVSDRVIQALQDAVNNVSIFNHKYYKKARNTAIFTVGLVLEHKSRWYSVENIVNWWVNYLPLEDEIKKQQKIEVILVNLLKTNSIDTKYLNPETIDRLKIMLKLQNYQ